MIEVQYGEKADIDSWIKLVKSVRRNFPGLETEEKIEEHKQTVLKFMSKKQAICVKTVNTSKVIGVLLFSRRLNMICCLAVSSEYRRQGIATALLNKALSELDKSQNITVSTFREGDVKAVAPRALYKKFGFIDGELSEEYGYPNQVLILKMNKREKAIELLEAGVAKNPGVWKEHSIAVAEAAEKVAIAVNEKCKEERLNSEKAYICGLLHDIGRQEGFTYIAHVYDGYHFLMKKGFPDAAKVALTHSFNLKIVDDYIGKIDITASQLDELKSLLENIEFDDYDRLIQLLDSCCAADGTKDLEKRMSDVKARYGYYPEGKWKRNFELKEYFETLMARSLYDVIA